MLREARLMGNCGKCKSGTKSSGPCEAVETINKVEGMTYTNGQKQRERHGKR